MKLIINYIIAAIIILIFDSCSDKITADDETGTYVSHAVLEWHGDYEVDGCGFFITINNETYKPENEEVIGTQFKKAGGMNVIVKYVETNTFKHFHCGGNPVEFSIKSLRIIWIKSS